MHRVNLDDFEIWLTVPGCPDYEASSWGHVRRATHGRSTYVGRLVGVDHGPEEYIGLAIGPYHFVHQVVARTFHGPCPEGKEVNHKDGLKNNNVPNNLEYLTKKENNDHAEETGLCDRNAALQKAMHVNRTTNFAAQKANVWQAHAASEAKNWEGQRAAMHETRKLAPAHPSDVTRKRLSKSMKT